jgi:hypothetical protein
VTNPVVFLLTGVEAEGSTIPEAVPVEGLAPETQGAAGGAPEPMEVAGGEAPAMAEGERGDVLPESTQEVVVHSPEIQDAEPIRSVLMSRAATSSHGGIELLVDDLVDPTAVRRTDTANQRGGSEWEPIKIHLEGDGNSYKMNTASNTRLRLTTKVGQAQVATGVPLDLGTNTHTLPTRERSGTPNLEPSDPHQSDR